MAFGKKLKEEIITAETKIWECSSPTCKGWIRDNFKSNPHPNCPFCQSNMIPTTKTLQVVENYSKWE
jgi:hypothetical protein